jgi:hypothetical protein
MAIMLHCVKGILCAAQKKFPALWRAPGIVAETWHFAVYGNSDSQTESNLLGCVSNKKA